MRPFFLNHAGRRLFCAHWPATAPAPSRPGILLLPPLFEDVNQVRSFHGRLARRFAASGGEVLQCDVSGTGDSSGEFVAARWTAWCEDLAAAAAWLGERCDVLHLVAVRGAALHVAALLAVAGSRVRGLRLVAPTVTGEAAVNEFLRIRVARSLFEGRRESVASLRERLAAGETVEIGGYELAGALAGDLQALSLDAAMLENLDDVRLVDAAGTAAQLDAWWLAVEAVRPGARRTSLDVELAWSVERPEPAPGVLDAVMDGWAA
ncbi:MAG: hypothetical protein AB7Q81_21890 [Gammaproteobacteria bacterium]